MTETQQLLIQIIANQLFGKRLDLPVTTDWHILLNEAKKQAVFSMVYSCIQKQYPDIFTGEEYRKYRQELFAHYAYATRNLNDHNELHRLLLSKGIQYVILKGPASAAYYPKTIVRSAGDVDFLVDRKDCLKVDELLSEAGFIRDTASENHGFHWAYHRQEETLECIGIFLELRKMTN